MEAKIKNCGEVTVVSIDGFLDIEHAQLFRATCVKRLGARKLVFNLGKASFVGSTGVKAFLDAVKNLCTVNDFGLKLVNARAEFRRIIENLGIHNLEFHESEDAAIASFSNSEAKVYTDN